MEELSLNNKAFHYKRLIREYDLKRSSAIKMHKKRCEESNTKFR